MNATAPVLDEPRQRSDAGAGAAVSSRIMSIDALRGFDMFWIIGMEEIFSGLSKFLHRDIEKQLDHARWAGFHFYDLIFPLFVFIIGTTLVFSLGKSVATHGKTGATLKILRRSVILYLLGIFYYGGFAGTIDHIRLMGVLQRLAICYCFAGLAFVWLSPRAMIIACVGLLAGYWALLTFVPVPGVGAGHFAEGQNLTNYIDRMYLPWRKWDGDHDPEGLLSNLPAIASCLLGVFAGLLLKNPSIAQRRKVTLLLVCGAAGIVCGLLWGLQFPIIKKIWSSSFVLLTAGISAILLAGFYWLIDVKNYRAWAKPFVWIGMNAITVYLACNVIGFGKVASRFAGGDVEAALNRKFGQGFGELILGVIGLGLAIWFVRFLYQRKIFLRV
jgi:predicted acyltransferase